MTDTPQDQTASGFHKLEAVAGDALNGHDAAPAAPPSDAAPQAAADVKGAAKELASAARQAVDQAPAQVRAAVDKVAGQARETYSAAQAKAQDLAAKVDPVVKAQPYRAIAIAAAVGFAVGHLTAALGPRTVYIDRR